MGLFVQIFNGFQPLTIFATSSILDVWQGSESHLCNTPSLCMLKTNIVIPNWSVVISVQGSKWRRQNEVSDVSIFKFIDKGIMTKSMTWISSKLERKIPEQLSDIILVSFSSTLKLGGTLIYVFAVNLVYVV